ncbi:hypothetical protein ACQZ4O_15795 [Agrobacterium vitis]|uniref:hypothetical protein n=1 Tax=Rhizobium/Agrobacterium group TaxID=227290 RepID=UPI0018D22824|nr:MULTISPECIES: hypothetical protein [Rhizobium/Agrobacterium group]
MTTDDVTFWTNAHAVLRDIGMPYLDPAHGAAVEIVRWCLAVRGRPTHRRQAFLEQQSPALLAYLETLGASGEAAGWRALGQRIRLHAEVLQGTQPYIRPWKAAIWHVLPELVAMGQAILDRQAEDNALAPEVAPTAAEANDGASGDGDKGSSGKSGAVGTTAKPCPASRLTLPPATVILTEAEKKALDLEDVSIGDMAADDISEDLDGTDGPKPPTGMGGPK